MTQTPACRARHLKEVLASVGRLPAATAAQIRGALPEAELRVVEESSGVEWLPIETNLRLTHSVHDALGLAEFQRFERAHFAALYRGPVYRAFLLGAKAVFGFDPAAWMRLLPESWNLTYRHCGTWRVDRGAPDRVGMSLHELPDVCARDRVWALAVASALSATLDVGNAEGAAELVSMGESPGEMRFELRWKPR